MKIHAHILCFNESDLIRFTVRHYQKYCDKITIYDNFSDDGSPDIARDMGCDVVQFGRPGLLEDAEYLKIKNNVWKGSEADFVIVCDMDEILVGPYERLEWANRFVIPGERPLVYKAKGFDVYSYSMPDPDTSWWGAIPNAMYDKCGLFSFDVGEINYLPGAHRCDPRTRSGQLISVIPDSFALLHFRYVGGPERLINRYRLYKDRMSPLNLIKGWGSQYLLEEEKLRKRFELGMKQAKPIEFNF